MKWNINGVKWSYKKIILRYDTVFIVKNYLFLDMNLKLNKKV